MKQLLLLTLVTLGVLMFSIFVSEYIKQDIICSKTDIWTFSYNECNFNK